ncbi:MAG: pantothenate kinase [Microcystaceae cyanobacterium]
MLPQHWLGLMIGNSRLHWAYFKQQTLQHCWNTSYVTNPSIFPLLPPQLTFQSLLPLYFASVVPSQTKIWQQYPFATQITLTDIPIKNCYPSLGIDRALAVLGAGKKYQFPCLVIDAGTALTFTGVDAKLNLIGGAILAGLSLQFQALAKDTAALPHLALPNYLPSQWALNTAHGIESGILYTILSGIEYFVKEWDKQFPQSVCLITGGDAAQILTYLKSHNEPLFKQIKQDEHLIFLGIKSCLT